MPALQPTQPSWAPRAGPSKAEQLPLSFGARPCPCLGAGTTFIPQQSLLGSGFSWQCSCSVPEKLCCHSGEFEELFELS